VFTNLTANNGRRDGPRGKPFLCKTCQEEVQARDYEQAVRCKLCEQWLTLHLTNEWTGDRYLNVNRGGGPECC